MSLLRLLRRPWSMSWRIVIVLIGYLLYLPYNGFQGTGMPYDAGGYWYLAMKFQRHHSFSLFYYDSPMRGYVGPLLMFPALVWRYVTNCTMLTAAKLAGAAWAALLFGAVGPALWHTVVPRPLAGGRWLLWVLAGSLFWCDHLSFTLTDWPALTLLVVSLAVLRFPHAGAWLLAGTALAAAINMRPVYLISLLPVLALAAWWQTQPQYSQGRSRRWMGLALGLALVFTPQLIINWQYFQSPTPLVLVEYPGNRSPLYLLQLTWGTRVQLYSATLQGCLVYADKAGVALMQAQHLSHFRNYGEFLTTIATHPLNCAWRYTRHLFNGLDVQHAAPYQHQIGGAGPMLLRLFNYPLLGLGLLMVLRGIRRSSHHLKQWPLRWVLLALLLPCAAAIPMAVENRFFLPLHLLLLALAIFNFQPATWARWARRPRRGMLLGLVVVLWLVGCWSLSISTERTLYGPAGTGQELIKLYKFE